MVKLRSWKEEIIMKAGAVLAPCGLLDASLATNGACVFPFFEPEQPDVLKNKLIYYLPQKQILN